MGAPSLDCCKASICGSGKLSPQWRQKIALRAENKACPDSEPIWDRMDFLHEVQFSAGIGPAHFLAETTRPLRYCLCAAKADPMNGAPSSNSDIAAFRRLPFSPYFYIPYLFAKWQWILRKKSWGKSDITSDTHTQTTGMNSE